MLDNQPREVPQAAAQGDHIRENDKIMLVLAYLGVLSLVPLLTVKDSDYVKFHARQGLALMLVWIGWIIMGTILSMVPFLGPLASWAGHLGLLTLAILGIVKALKPERWRIPAVASIADKFGK